VRRPGGPRIAHDRRRPGHCFFPEARTSPART
jgi:hypothetical protein